MDKNSKSILMSIKLNSLKLDVNNPRFAELYSGSDNEDELIDYLLFNESAEDVAKGISTAGEFYPDRPLWVLQDGDSYIIKDGNRRCAAVKALRHPSKFGLDLPKREIKELPVLLYANRTDLEARIIHEHTNSLFREWDRIAKALEAYKMFNSGNSLDSMKEIDTQPSQLIKLASFYYKAVKIGGDDLRKLLRRGRGKTGGKTIIFERLFKYSSLCGYHFRNKPSYKIVIDDKQQFELYIKALVNFLKNSPEDTKTDDVDKEKEAFLKRLEPYGFKIKEKLDDVTSNSKESQEGIKTNENPSSIYENANNQLAEEKQDSALLKDHSSNRKSVKTRPIYSRKKIPSTLEKLIKECYSIDGKSFPNAKTALARVTFECTLKYAIENTRFNKKSEICKSNYFRGAFYDNKGTKKTYTDFSKLKTLFTELIIDTGIRKAFENFDIEKTHQIIHNYHVGAHFSDAVGLCDNLIPLLEFMLQDEVDLINSIERSKL